MVRSGTHGRHGRRHRSGEPSRQSRRAGRGGVGLALVFARPPYRPEVPPVDPAWIHFVRPVARIAIWVLPVYAAVYLWWALLEVPDPRGDPLVWVDQVASASYQQTRIVAGFGSMTLGLVAMVALVGLLIGMRGRWVALVGLLTGLGSTAILLSQVGLWTFTAATVADTVPGAAPAALLYARMLDEAGSTLALGLCLLTAAWLLLGLAVWRSGVFNRGDGVLLMLGGGLIGITELVAPAVVPLGALLLIAAGLGIAWNAGRVTGGRRAALTQVQGEPERAAA
jgi:hypothetical protein